MRNGFRILAFALRAGTDLELIFMARVHLGKEGQAFIQ